MNIYASPNGVAVRLSGKIKWFNRSKGFGFIVPDDGTADIFLPLAVLERSGFDAPLDGASITFEWVAGPKGRAATQVLDLDASTATQRVPRAHHEFRPREARGEGAPGPTEPCDGVVKWYDPSRGFGFIQPNDGGRDIFFHVTALRQAGIDGLQPGQSVHVMVAEGRRGREAKSVALNAY